MVSVKYDFLGSLLVTRMDFLAPELQLPGFNFNDIFPSPPGGIA